MPPESIADAASLVLLRGTGDQREVLMGQRGARAAFMPSKFVFPGGRVDADDFIQDMPDILSPICRAALLADLRGLAPPRLDHAIAAASLRELAEETGLTLARPRANALRFVFRAITPPGRTRRFDARFFAADADDFAGDHQGFSGASGELTSLQWVTLPLARSLDLPFITRVILAEIAQDDAGQGVPFFDNSFNPPLFSRL